MPIFEGQDPNLVMELAFSMERCFIASGEDVITAGSLGSEMYFIIDGKVEVIIDLPDGMRTKRVAVLRQPDFFGV